MTFRLMFLISGKVFAGLNNVNIFSKFLIPHALDKTYAINWNDFQNKTLRLGEGFG
jgi:hypothetical protein